MFDGDTGERIFREGLPISIVRKVMDLAKEAGIYCHTYNGESIVCRHAAPETDYYRKYIPMPVLTDEEDPASLLTEEPCKCIAITLGDTAPLEALRLRLIQKLGDQVHVFYSNPNYLEVVSHRANKGIALRQLCRRLGIPVANSIAAGDSSNDTSMLEAAGLGVLMCNGYQEMPALKDSADMITQKDNDHDGLVEILQ